MSPKKRETLRRQIVHSMISNQQYPRIVAEKAADQAIDALTFASVVKLTTSSV